MELKRLHAAQVWVTIASVLTSAAAPSSAVTRSDPVLAHGRRQWAETDKVHRGEFPRSFIFGTAASSYQYEGAVHEGGRGCSIWDTASHTPGSTSDNSTGDVALDHYHRYLDDVELIKNMGMDAHRLSIAWPRIFPDGKGPNVNKDGVAYYNRLIDSLLAKGIQPFVTLYHWDLPQALEDEFGGWLSPRIVPIFALYAEACFEAFGDRVKYWITFNEPHGFSIKEVNMGCNHPSGDCGNGDISTEPYIAGHNVLLSHARAAHIYRTRFQAKQGGSIGIALDSYWVEPLRDTPQDKKAAERMILYQTGWFTDPLFFGNYPEVMRKRLGERIPSFTEEEKCAVKGSVDFVGINHYTSYWVTDKQLGSPSKLKYYAPFFDGPEVTPYVVRDGIPIGPHGASNWLNVVPHGMRGILNWLRLRYKNPLVFVTENGNFKSLTSLQQVELRS